MMGPKQEAQHAMFYEFSLEDHVPQDHLLRSTDRFVDLGSILAHLADFYSHTGRPSVDPEQLIWMLLVVRLTANIHEARLLDLVRHQSGRRNHIMWNDRALPRPIIAAPPLSNRVNQRQTNQSTEFLNTISALLTLRTFNRRITFTPYERALLQQMS